VLRQAAVFLRPGSKALATRAMKIRERLAGSRAGARNLAAATPSPQPYLVAPRGGRGPGVLVLHPWWGLTGAVRGICDRLAAEGFVAVAPDLYGGRLARTAREAGKLRAARRPEPMWKTIWRSIETLLTHRATAGRRIGAVGLSMGGHWALWFASRPESPIAATVVFYAARASAFSRGSSSAFQFHLAEHDDFVSPAAVLGMQRALQAARRRSETWVYPGTRHWFFEPDRPEHDAKSAALAWTRVLAFLRAELDGGDSGQREIG